jgi:hypothetical protein
MVLIKKTPTYYFSLLRELAQGSRGVEPASLTDACVLVLGCGFQGDLESGLAVDFAQGLSFERELGLSRAPLLRPAI